MVGWIGRAISQISGSVGVSQSPSSEAVAKTLERQASSVFDPSNYKSTDIFEYALELAYDIALEFNLPQSTELLAAITDCIESLVTSNAIMPPDVTWELVDHEGDEGYRLRKYLERHKRFHANFMVNDTRFRSGIFSIFATFFEQLPQLLDEGATSSKGFGVQLGDLLPNKSPAWIL